MSEERSFGSDLEDVSLEANKHKERKVIGACLLCGSEVYEYGWGWGCSKGKDECEFSINRTLCGHVITDQEISDLLIKGETEVIKGFVGKSGRSFDAKITYKDKFAFEFADDKKEA